MNPPVDQAAVEALPESTPLPVFVSSDGRRARVLRLVGRVVAGLTVLWLVSLLAGVIGVLALMLYLAARQRTRVAAYALSRRMGLTRRRHVLSLLVELAVAVGIGAVLGTVLARLVLVPVVPLLDLKPGWPPEATTLVLPTGVLLGVLTAAVAVVLSGALAAQLVADRTRPADVLRGEQ